MSNSLPHEYLGWLKMTLEATDAGRLAEARTAAERLIEVATPLTPLHRSQAYVAAATVALRQSRVSTAMREYSLAIDELDPICGEDPANDGGASIRLARATAHVLLGEALYANHEPRRAAQSYESAFNDTEVVASVWPGSATQAIQHAVRWRVELLGHDIEAAQHGLVSASDRQREWATLVRRACEDVARVASMGEQVADLRARVVVAAGKAGLELHSKNEFELMLDTLQPGLEHAQVLSDTSDDQDVLPMVTQFLLLLAEALIALERSDEAIPHLERAADAARSVDGRGSFASETAGMIPVIEARLAIARDRARADSARVDPPDAPVRPADTNASPASEVPTPEVVGPDDDEDGNEADGDDPVHALLDDPTNIAGYAALGGDPNIARPDGVPLLVAAAASVEAHVTQLLLANDADVAARDRLGRTALHLAVTRDDDRIARLLLEHGADPDAEDEDGWTPAMYAAAWGSQPSIVRLLADRGADLTAPANGPLVGAAAFQSRPYMITAFSAHGANPDARLPGENGVGAATALMIAALRNDRTDVIRALVDAGADAAATTHEGLTAAHFAAARRDGSHHDVLSILADAGADLSATSDDGTSVDAVAQAHQATYGQRAAS